MSWLVENTIIAGAGACLVYLTCRIFNPRPALAHVLWLLVLVKLLCPPVLRLSLPVAPAGWDPFGSRTAATAPKTPLVTTLDDDTGTVSTGGRAIPLAVAPYDDSLHGRSSGATQPFREPTRKTVWTAPEGFALAWILGSGVVLASMLIGIARVRRLTRNGTDAPAWLRREVDLLARRLRIDEPRVVVSPRIGSAFVWGLGRPTVMWPAACDEPQTARSVLAHELAHVRRRDHWTAWLEIVATVGLWWHPLLWIVRSRLRLQAELACDAWAVWAVPQGRHAYAGALIDAVEQESQAVATVPVLAARPGARRAFEKRLLMILNEDVPRRLSRWAVLPVVALAFTVPAGFSFAQERGEKRSKKREATSEREIQKDVLRTVNEHLREKLGRKYQVKSLDEIDRVVEEFVREHQDKTKKKAKEKRKIKRIEIERGASAEELRKALEEARREIREDEDLKKLGITRDVEKILEGALRESGDWGEGLEDVIRKAMKLGLREAKIEIRNDEDLEKLGIAGDVEVLVEGLLGEGGDFGKGLEGVIRKSLRHGLNEAKIEIRHDEDLKRLGITGDVEVMIEGLLGEKGKGDFGEGLEAIIRKSLRHAQEGERKADRGTERAEQQLERLRRELRRAREELDRLERAQKRKKKDRII